MVVTINCLMVHPNAVLPTKAYPDDAGYDLTIVEKIKQVGDVSFYTTGLKIRPSKGWDTRIYPRSSISKTGYVLANSVGVVDNTYSGEVIIALRKVDKSMPNMELPCRAAQLVIVQTIDSQIVEVDELDETDRGSGGFGSTGQ